MGSAQLLEQSLLQLSQVFLWPVNLLVLLIFGYSLLALGAFLIEAYQRLKRPRDLLFMATDDAVAELLELKVLAELEGLRLASRVAPMLGLVATMIPLGPALLAVSSGRAEEVAAGLASAFAAVIVALVSASITFAVYTVRRRWLLQEVAQRLVQPPTSPRDS